MGLLDLARRMDPRRLLRPLLDFVYPSRCAVCEGPFEGRPPLCPSCLVGLMKRESAPACELCAAPVARDGAPCPFCRGRGLYPFARIARLGPYDGSIRTLIHHLKFRRAWTVGEFLAQRLHAQERVRAILADADALVPVPLHWKRQFARGFNQAHVLARRLSRLGLLPIVRPAVRLRDTQTQLRFSIAARHDNMRGAFGLLGPRPIAGRRLVLIDDVKTSGATLQSLARALLPAGPSCVSAIVVGVADPRHRDFEAV